MRYLLIFFSVAILTCIVFADEAKLPLVKTSYTNMQAGLFKGKTIAEIIQADQVEVIAFTVNRGRESALSKELTANWDSDELMRALFASDEKANDVSINSMEAKFAEYSIVTKSGNLFLLHVLGNPVKEQSVAAVLLFGDGFGCRLNISKKNMPNQLIDSDEK